MFHFRSREAADATRARGFFRDAAIFPLTRESGFVILRKYFTALRFFSSLPDVKTTAGLLMPDLRGMSYRQVLLTMQQKQLNLKLSGSGQVVEQSPSPGAKIRYGKEAWARLGARKVI